MSEKMQRTGLWTNDHQMEAAKEGMEKLLMNKLYSNVFMNEDDRKGDFELKSMIDSVSPWLKESHLDIPRVPTPSLIDTDNIEACENSQPCYYKAAGSELEKMNDYKSPKDKIVCLMNCCKIIFGKKTEIIEIILFTRKYMLQAYWKNYIEPKDQRTISSQFWYMLLLFVAQGICTLMSSNAHLWVCFSDQF